MVSLVHDPAFLAARPALLIACISLSATPKVRRALMMHSTVMPVAHTSAFPSSTPGSHVSTISRDGLVATHSGALNPEVPYVVRPGRILWRSAARPKSTRVTQRDSGLTLRLSGLRSPWASPA
eukprot:3319329-Rhodomonas_salina.1